MENNKENFYSRQIYTYGYETMKNLSKLKILIVGLRGLGMEIAKNLILSGPKEIYLYDKNKITIFDLGSGFYFSEEKINKFCRDEGCIEQLSKLNSFVEVNILNEDIITALNNNCFNIIIITELLEEEKLYQINEICRKNNIGFIYGCTLGLIGFIFIDFGYNFHIYNKYGKEPKTFYINNITNEEKAVIIIDPSSIQDTFLSNDSYIIISDVEGMTEINNDIPIKVIRIDNNKITININTSRFNKYLKGGIIKEYFQKIEKSYQSLKYNFENPICNIDFKEDENTCQRHSLIVGIHKYYSKYKSLPELNNLNQANEVFQLSKEYFERKKLEQNEIFLEKDNLDEDISINLSKWLKAELPPYCNFFGGIISQEVVKYTGKYIPLEQWAWFDFYDTVRNIKNPNRNLLNSRYDEQIAIYGLETQKKLNNLNIFMIGAGALGCEYLKLFSMMGIANNENKKITVTDNDNIEVSNLNRQFLFKKEHIGKSKSKTACEEIKKMNKNFNCETHQNLVNEDTEIIYNENFWKSQDFIINAVDNIKARKYIDYNCTIFNKILIDSGTEGTKASSQLIIPHKTKCYNETHIGEVKENIPMCTLRLFPSNIQQCIEWGKDKFNEYFFEDIKNLQDFINEPLKYLNKIQDDENKTEILSKMKILLEIKSENNIGKCIELGKNIFSKLFSHDIQNIIDLFPQDYKNEDNTYFWSGSKKFPKIISINTEKDYSKKFIIYFTKILLNALNVKCRPYLDLNEFYDTHRYYTSKNDINIENKLLDLSRKVKINNINPEIFEKDIDSNNHINFIHICSNLRAKNYNIEECDKLKVKLLAGKIIPAVSSTTSAITGFVSSQIYALINNNDINILKDIRFNIATNSYFIMNPQKVVGKIDQQGKKGLIVAVPKNWTCWDHIEIQGPKTIRQFFEYIKDKYKIDVKGMFTFDKESLIQSKEMLEYNIENAYSVVKKKNIGQLRRTLSFTINGKNENNYSVNMPVFIYRY